MTEYDRIPYPTAPQPQTHPDRLAAVGKLFGMEPAPVERCRVLEIACGDGGNLVPMACNLPGSRFVGVDLAASAIAAAREMADDLELKNVELHACDLREIGSGWGEFDYIVAHGLYSWVPADVRESLLTVCRERLAGEGIALVSYNAYPGGYARQMLREMMLYLVRDVADGREKAGRAREFLQTLCDSSLSAVSEEAKLLLDREDGALYHDELAACNDRFYFHEFAAAACRHGLQYLGEAEPHQMFDPNRNLPGDIIEREQYMDFLKGRRFRQTLLCRAERGLRRETSAGQMAGFRFSASAQGVRMGTGNEAAAAVAMALGEVYPLPLAFEDLVPYAGSGGTLAAILYSMTMAGFVDLHVYDFPCEEGVTEHPRATRLARYQATRSHEATSVCHINVELDEPGRRLVILLDGTRTHEDLAAALGLDFEELQSRLEWLASRGLLEA
ncbi:MAG TPA: class I SAM-dependent methyltransferase [Bryobacteraceae bacterium]|nr:class I SAM-dependent methyltransferase [Bryobacteraceae bacterium]